MSTEYFLNEFEVSNNVLILDRDDKYVANFGKQWRDHVDIQIDSKNGTTCSQDLLENVIFDDLWRSFRELFNVISSFSKLDLPPLLMPYNKLNCFSSNSSSLNFLKFLTLRLNMLSQVFSNLRILCKSQFPSALFS